MIRKITDIFVIKSQRTKDIFPGDISTKNSQQFMLLTKNVFQRNGKKIN